MLAKLLKHEFKATARIFLPLYLILLIFGLINRIFNVFDIFGDSISFNMQSTLSVISSIIYFTLIVAIIVMTLVIMIQRFYKNLLGDEGYLMFTLPVKPWQHIVSKLIISMLWSGLSLIVIISSIAILIGIKDTLAALSRGINFFIESLGYTGLLTACSYAILMFILYVLMIYSAISLGHLFPKYKLLASFGMYSVLYIINQVVTTVVLLTFGNKALANIISNSPTPSQIINFIQSLLPVPILLIVGNFLLTKFILEKHLNLE